MLYFVPSDSEVRKAHFIGPVQNQTTILAHQSPSLLRFCIVIIIIIIVITYWLTKALSLFGFCIIIIIIIMVSFLLVMITYYHQWDQKYLCRIATSFPSYWRHCFHY